MEKPEFSRMMTISTAHIPPALAETLQTNGYITTADSDLSIPCYCKNIDGENNGFFIPTTPIDTAIIDNEEIIYVIEYARNHGCGWVCLDSDGPIVDELPIYEWEEEEDRDNIETER